VTATRQRFGAGPLTRYQAQVVVPADTLAEIAVLKALAAHQVMQPRLTDPIYLEQRAIIGQLYSELNARPDQLEPEFWADYQVAADDQARGRVVVDQIASLTDASAGLILHRLTGD